MWVFPDEAQLVETGVEQILMQNIHVTYMQSVRIKCRVENALDNATEKVITLVKFILM